MVQEWQASSHGNPEVTQFLETRFQPDSPRVAETTPPKPTVEAVKTAAASFFHDDFQAAVTSKRATTPPPHHKTAQKPSKELEILIPVGSDVVGMVTEMVAQGGGAVEEGNTIIEEDTSILEELDTAFVMEQEQMEFLKMYGVEEGELDFRCLSDGGTEVDSEFDKIEYEFQPIRGEFREEMEDDEEKEDEIEDGEMRGDDDDEHCSVEENKMTVEFFGDTEEVDNGPTNGDAIDVDTLPRQPDSKGYQFNILPPGPSVDTPNPSNADISSAPRMISQFQQSTSNTIPEESSPLSVMVEESAPSSPFSNIIIGMQNLRKSDGDVRYKEKKDGKEDLRNFLLRSGLFVVKN